MKLETGNVVKLRGKTGIIVENPYEKINCNLKICYAILDKHGNFIEVINSAEDLENIVKEFESEVLLGVAADLT
jgi:hypothetical protein